MISCSYIKMEEETAVKGTDQCACEAQRVGELSPLVKAA